MPQPALSQAIDVHAHYYPESYLALVRDEGPRFGASFRDTPDGPHLEVGLLKVGPIGPCYVDFDARFAIMDRQRIHMQAVSLTQPMVYWGDRAFSVDLSVVYNDDANAAHERYPDRIVGVASLPMFYPDAAVRELERAAKLPGIRGVGMATTIGDRELSDTTFWPVFEAVEALGLTIFLHPLRVVGHERLEAHYLNNYLGNPFDAAVAAARLIFDGVLDRFPNLEVSLPHAGGALPILVGRLDRGYATQREKGESRLPAQPPSRYLRRFTYDTIAHSQEALRHLVGLVGADRLVMGTDHCFDMGDHDPVRTIELLDVLDDDDRANILGRTAARLLRVGGASVGDPRGFAASRPCAPPDTRT